MNHSGIYKSSKELNLNEDRFHTVIQCSKYPNFDTYYSLLARRLHLPDYFGKNLDALEECLTDLSWIKEKQLVIEFRDSKSLLKNENDKDKKSMWNVLKDACKYWKKHDLELIIIKD